VASCALLLSNSGARASVRLAVAIASKDVLGIVIMLLLPATDFPVDNWSMTPLRLTLRNSMS
jgi:hypothetical protein